MIDKPNASDSLSALSDETIELLPLAGEKASPAAAPAKPPRQRLLWVTLCCVGLGAGGLHYHSTGKISRLQQQLIATQDSFAKISSETGEYMQSVSGQLSASQLSAHTELRELQSGLRQLQQQQSSLLERLPGLQQELTALQQHQQQAAQRQQQQASATGEALLSLDSTQQQQTLQLKAAQQALKELQEEQQQRSQSMQTLHQHLRAAGEQLESVSVHIELLEQQLSMQQDKQLLLEPLLQQVTGLLQRQQEVEQEFQAYRAQTTRTLNALNQRSNEKQ